jgi:hypothetical protein
MEHSPTQMVNMIDQAGQVTTVLRSGKSTIPLN